MWTKGIIVFLLLAVGGSMFFLSSTLGRRVITRAIEHKVRRYANNAHLETISGWFPLSYTIPTLTIPGILELSQLHHRHPLFDTLLDDVVVESVTLLGIPLGSGHVVHQALEDVDEYKVTVAGWTLRVLTNPWTNATLSRRNETLVLSRGALVLDRVIRYHVDNQTIFVEDHRPPSTLAPLRTISWNNEGVEVDIGSHVLRINANGVQHGPARAWYANHTVFVELSSIQYKTFQCLNATALTTDGHVALLPHLSALTTHNELFEGSGTYTFETKELDLTLNIKF